MFKLNRMTHYAMVVLVALARRQRQNVAATQLAKLTGLNQPTVAKVVKTLVAAGLPDIQRGVHGGYRLSREAPKISLVQIAESMKGCVVANDYFDGAEGPYMVSNCCQKSRSWSFVHQSIIDVLGEVSLEDLISPAQSVTPAGREQLMDHHAPTARMTEMLS